MLGFEDLAANQVLLASIAAWCIYAVSQAFHNLFFHPLAKFPGPKLRGAFYFPNNIEIYVGNHIYNWHELHEKYGDIIRIAPNTLSTIRPDAWKDIYGYGSKQPMSKCPEFYYREHGVAADIIAANDQDHTRMRRLLSYAFSEQALRSQEDIVTSYIDLMISKLRNRAAAGTAVDIMRYFNFTTFDITGDLTFGESFGSLVSEDYDHWIANIFRVIRLVCVIQVMRCYGLAAHKLFKVIPALAKGMEEHKNYTEDKMTKRLETPTDRKDFMSYVLKHNDERGMTRAEMNANSSILIMAGSETSATLLSGLVYHLLQNSVWMAKLQDEVRTTFTEEAQITFTSTSQLKLMTAIIQETLRVYPPVAGSMPRIVPKEGALVAGTFIPGDTTIGIPQYVASRSSRNFKDPDKFAPERFLGDERYAADNRSVTQPFSVGPRNCIGQTLAWAEVRTILGRLIWNFDLELLDTSKGWERQKVFVLWSKPSLMVKLKARNL